MLVSRKIVREVPEATWPPAKIGAINTTPLTSIFVEVNPHIQAKLVQAMREKMNAQKLQHVSVLRVYSLSTISLIISFDWLRMMGDLRQLLEH